MESICDPACQNVIVGFLTVAFAFALATPIALVIVTAIKLFVKGF